MTPAVFYLMLAATLANSPGAVDKSGASQSPAADPSAGGSGGEWKNLGATACAKYFTPQVNAALLPGPGTPKTRNATSCTVETPGGSIQLSLASEKVASFNAGAQFLPIRWRCPVLATGRCSTLTASRRGRLPTECAPSCWWAMTAFSNSRAHS